MGRFVLAFVAASAMLIGPSLAADIPQQQILTDLESFLKYDYAQTTDLAKAFITLVSGVLVFSVTFTEKIINWDKADGYSKTMMLACWILLVLAIILCGIGLCLMFAASTAALHPTATINNEKVNILWYIPAYGRVDNYIITAMHSWTVIGMAGCSFVISLTLLPIVAFRKLRADPGIV